MDPGDDFVAVAEALQGLLGSQAFAVGPPETSTMPIDDVLEEP